MNYPFEQTKDYSKKFLTTEDQNAFTELKALVTNLDEQGVQQWFNRENTRLEIKGKENLAKAIGNYTYYFSVQITGFKNVKEIEECENMKYKILLKHFKLEDQFSILTQKFDIENEEIFTLLYQTAKIQKKENIFYNSRIILDPLVKMYHKEDFDKLKKIEKIIERNMVDLENPYMAFCIDNGASYFKLKNNYTITDEIMLNYSDNKKDFILSYNKDLPLKNKAYQLLEDIQTDYNERAYLTVADQETIGKITKHIDNYLKAILYFELNNKLPEKSIKSSLNKI